MVILAPHKAILRALTFGLILIWCTTGWAQDRGIKITTPESASPLPHIKNFYDDSYAMLIGVSDYSHGTSWPDLPGVIKDINLVEISLQQQGFQVIKVINPTRRELDMAFNNFISIYGQGMNNRLLFYFAGHGFTRKQMYGDEVGYIIPADTPDPEKDINGFMLKAMDMQQIEVYAKRIQSKHAMFLFDSCFSGTIFSLSRAAKTPQNISYKIQKPVRQFITSGSAYEKVPDESVFRGQFIAALQGEADMNKDGFVTGMELGMFLQDSVINYSEGSLHPQYGKIRHPVLDKGDFLFPLPTAEDLKKFNDKFDDDIARLEKERKEWEKKRKKLMEEKRLAQERSTHEMAGNENKEKKMEETLKEIQQLKKNMNDLNKNQQTISPSEMPDVEMCWDEEEMQDVPCGTRGTY